jgi:DNA mismatch repair protein MSH5
MVRPDMTEDSALDIKAGRSVSTRLSSCVDDSRHILQELSVSSYIPNDTYLSTRQRSSSSLGDALGSLNETNDGPQGPSVLIMTGPNYSGKSVYLKQVALIVYLAHIGRYLIRS